MLLDRMIALVMQRGIARPSMRQLAKAADVTVPTLQHYFGTRSGVVRAVLAHYLSQGKRRLNAVAQRPAPFADSIHEFARSLIAAVDSPRPVKLGDVFAISLAEGLLDDEIGPASLGFILDPSVDALRTRLEQHIELGEMRRSDTRAAALMLLSPLLLAILHQDHMGGRSCNPADVPALAAEICDAFIRAYTA